MTIDVKVPDIGDFKDVPVIDVLVKPGDVVNAEDAIVTLESDKATLDVPSPRAGTIRELRVKVGDKVSEGSPLLTLDEDGATTAKASQSVASAESDAQAGSSAQTASTVTAERASAVPERAAAAAMAQRPYAPAASAPAVPGNGARADRDDAAVEAAAPPPIGADFTGAHASPSVRAFARELGADLARVKGSGPKSRILHDDVRAFVKQVMSGPAVAPVAAAGGVGGLNLLPWPQVDFAKFGPVEAKPLSRIKRISGANLVRNWVMIPHVTNHDDADVTELEALRVALNRENEKSGVRVTMLAFLIKACVSALARFPEFNASLDGENLVYKRYFHIGFAADTPNGLVVPVVRDADQKGVLAIAKETAELAAKARDGKLAPSDMQGGCFSVSSLGGIGGTYFTPIINAPEVAILGVCRSSTRPVWDGSAFAPRLMLPLSLSWDHRVIDGATAARFLAYLCALLADMRRALV